MVTVMAIGGGYALAGATTGLLLLHHWGWENAANAQGHFHLKNDDLGGAGAAALFWPVAVVIVFVILLGNSARQGLINRLAEGRKPPRRFRERVAQRQASRSLAAPKDKWD